MKLTGQGIITLILLLGFVCSENVCLDPLAIKCNLIENSDEKCVDNAILMP